jgi:hypothetical protein
MSYLIVAKYRAELQQHFLLCLLCPKQYGISRDIRNGFRHSSKSNNGVEYSEQLATPRDWYGVSISYGCDCHDSPVYCIVSGPSLQLIFSLISCVDKQHTQRISQKERKKGYSCTR